jgi:hypothetical protein
VIIFAVKIVSIYLEAPTFERRIAMMEHEIDVARELGIRKGIIGEANVTRRSSVDPNWSYAIETMLLSARQGKDSVVTICLDSDMAFESNAGRIGDSDFLMRRWDIKSLTWLNDDYFRLPVGRYQSFNGSYDSIDISDEMVRSVELQFIGDAFHIPRGEFGFTTIRISQMGGISVPADTSYGINVSYHWFHGEDLITWDGHRTPLEIDLVPGLEYLQTIDILAPDQTGHYILVVDLVAEGRRWFGIDRRQEFWVY